MSVAKGRCARFKKEAGDIVIPFLDLSLLHAAKTYHSTRQRPSNFMEMEDVEFKRRAVAIIAATS